MSKGPGVFFVGKYEAVLKKCDGGLRDLTKVIVPFKRHQRSISERTQECDGVEEIGFRRPWLVSDANLALGVGFDGRLC
jgi:hypothetical protein